MEKKDLLQSVVASVSERGSMHEFVEIKNLRDMAGVANSAYLYYSTIIYCYLTENDAVSECLQMNVKIDDKVFSTDGYRDLLASLKSLKSAEYFCAEIKVSGPALNSEVSVDKFDDELIGLFDENSFTEGLFSVLSSVDALENVTYKNIISNCESYFFARIVDGVCNVNDEIFANPDIKECDFISEDEEWYSWSILGSIEYSSLQPEYETVYENLKDVIRKYAPADEIIQYCEPAWEDEEFGSNLLTADIQWITNDLTDVSLMLDDMNKMLEDYKKDIKVDFYGDWLLMDSFCVARIINTDKGLAVKCLSL